MRRGFTLVEVMITVAVIGILSALTVPTYTMFTARAHRAEMQMVLPKLRQYFLQTLSEKGSFGADISNASTNPPAGLAPIGQPAAWDPQATGWANIPVSAEGALRMRYWYSIAGNQLTLQVSGHFPGVGSYTYAETYQGANLVLVTEVPGF